MSKKRRPQRQKPGAIQGQDDERVELSSMNDNELANLARNGMLAVAILEKRHGKAGKALVVAKLENAMEGDLQQVIEDLEQAPDAEAKLAAVRIMLDKQVNKLGSSALFTQREYLLRELVGNHQKLYKQERRIEHVLKNQDIVMWMTTTVASLTYVALFSMIIGRTKPTVRLLEQLQPQIENLPIDKFIEDFPSEDTKSHDELRQNHQRVTSLVADFIKGKVPDFDTLRDMFVAGIDDPGSIENITSLLRELQEAVAAAKPGPDAEDDTEIAQRLVKQAKKELQIEELQHGDIDRIRTRAKILLLRECNVDDESQLGTVYQLAYSHLSDKHKGTISRWANQTVAR